MYFRMLFDDASAAVSYLLADLSAGDAVLVDPQPADLPVLRAMLAEHRLQLRWTVCTHLHGESPSALATLAALGAPCVARALPPQPLLDFGDEHLSVLPTPGHTAHCLSFRWRDRLFCGDLLTVDLCPHQPRPALPEALWDTVQSRVFTLPDETLLFGAHARCGRAASTVFEQRRWHPFFAGAGRDEFIARVAAPEPLRTALH